MNAIGTITAIPIADKNVTLSPASAVYDGTEQKPTVTIAGLTEGTDYTVSYIGDFTKAGEHTVTVTGKGELYRDSNEKNMRSVKRMCLPVIWLIRRLLTCSIPDSPKRRP